MVSSINVSSTISLATDWEAQAFKVLRDRPVGVMEKTEAEDGFTIFARVVGYVDSPIYGRLLQIERVGGEPTTPVPETVDG